MAIRPVLRNILEIVGRLSHYDVHANVVDTELVQHSGLSAIEVYDCLNELDKLGFIKMLQPIGDSKEKKDNQTFKLMNITEQGLQELKSSQTQL